MHTDGFRGPGIQPLRDDPAGAACGGATRYDASTLPTYIGPLARAYYFRTAKLTADQRAERELLYGTWADGRRAVRPYRWAVGDRTLLELPVTTLPGPKIPIHVSYLLMLSTYSPAAARAYFDAALRVCRAAGVGPSILLHPLDLISGDDVKALAFFPGMQIPRRREARPSRLLPRAAPPALRRGPGRGARRGARRSASCRSGRPCSRPRRERRRGARHGAGDG